MTSAPLSLEEGHHMAHALRLAERGLGNTWPNPSVGCVILAQGHVVGRGWTQPGGRPHAETQALAQAGVQARGAVVYVSLEPCAHYGKTPPCAQALIEAGVARVISAMTDPDPRVAGRGHDMLRTAGIIVHEGLGQKEAARLNAGFFKRVQHGLPFVTLKTASTLDGRIATHSGESRWITGPEARRFVHRLRLSHDAVMIGSGTALADNPDLRVRDMGQVRQPVRIVLDSMLRHSPDSRLGTDMGAAPVWMVHGPQASAQAQAAWQQAGARLFACPVGNDGHLCLRSALKLLAEAGLTRILCEGGAGLAAALLRASRPQQATDPTGNSPANVPLVDEWVQFSAGKALGAEGIPVMAELGLHALTDAPIFRLLATDQLGGDVMSHWAWGHNTE